MHKNEIKIYVASSWKNPQHEVVIEDLRGRGYQVYDYRKVNVAFSWEAIDPNYEKWTPEEYLLALGCLDVSEAFWKDMNALHEADVVLGLDPLGVSSALELGWAVGHGKPAVLLVEDTVKPELMSKMIPFRVCQLEDLIITLESLVMEQQNEKKN